MTLHQLKTEQIELAVSEEGGHLWPVRFKGDSGWLEPMHCAPWAEESLPEGTPPVIRILRGDFFCAPFGDNDLDPTETRGHGATANGRWRLAARSEHRLELHLEQPVMGAKVVKRVWLEPGQPLVYQEHEFVGGAGTLPVGHHAMLRFGSPGHLSFSPYFWGATPPQPVEPDPALGRSLLAYPQRFERLEELRLAEGGVIDGTLYPQLEGHEDILMLTAQPELPVAWSAVANPQAGWLWFGLKSPQTLPSTLLWMSNGGRRYPPWSGRHTGVLGVEEVSSYFHLGHRASSQPNPVNQAGIATGVRLESSGSLKIGYVFGAVPIPPSFGRRTEIEVARGSLKISGDGYQRTLEADLGSVFGSV